MVFCFVSRQVPSPLLENEFTTNGLSPALVVIGMITEDICVTHVFIFSVTNKENVSGGYVSLFFAGKRSRSNSIC